MKVGLSPLRGLPTLREGKTRRFSSFDRTGGNDDRFHVDPGETVSIAEMVGAGVITHIWMTLDCDSPRFLRKVILRAYWDDEDSPSVECPIGDFFGMGHARTANFTSLPLQASPQDGRGFNCYFPMPFGSDMKMTVTNESESELLLYYYVDLEVHETLEEGVGRFHAQYRQATPVGIDETGMRNEQVLFGGVNVDGTDNYTILDAHGHGHYVGCVFNVYSRRRAAAWDWYGEGDDMIFIDGEQGFMTPDGVRRPDSRLHASEQVARAQAESAPGANDAWPPTLHGTGTEDYFNTAWCPTQEYSAPYHGIIAGGGTNWAGPVTLYRFHIEDPAIFHQCIRVTIEHGHANRRGDEISSVAFWYQAEPHVSFSTLPPVEERLPGDRAPYEHWW